LYEKAERCHAALRFRYSFRLSSHVSRITTMFERTSGFQEVGALCSASPRADTITLSFLAVSTDLPDEHCPSYRMTTKAR
jgi:hypothetical protein